MTTAAITPEIKVDRDPMRILSITANLLPIEITDARRENKLRWIVLAALVVVLAGLGLWDFQARHETSNAQATLAQKQTALSKLQSAQHQYAALSTAKGSAAAIDTELTKLMAQDVPWYQLVPALRSAASTSGITVSNIASTLSTANANAAPATAGVVAPGASASSVSTIGSITITGIAPDKPSAAAFLDQLAKVAGVSNPYLNSLNAQGSQYQFTLQADITSALYKGRYTPASTNGGK
jgi:Tfp pilus assembly protein PilN